MNEVVQFLLRHGYAVLFIWVLAEQIGAPVPAAPLLLAAGVLAGAGSLHFIAAFILAVVACLLSDLIWYLIGRYKGGSVLSLLCKISLSPDSCVRRTEDLFYRHGARSLLVAKFIPGLSTVAPPLAGVFRMTLFRFLFYDGSGACLWAGSFLGLGYLFSDQIEEIAAYAMRLGVSLVGLVVAGLAGYITWKYIHRRRFLNRLRIARISPEELKNKLDAGEEILVLDVRHPLDFAAMPQTIPGAIYFPLEDLEKEHPRIPRDRDVILYCS